MQALSGGTAFITGGAGGIGLALAADLLGRGMKVAIADLPSPRLADALESLSGAGEAMAVELDVRDAAAWEASKARVEATLGPVRFLVSNAGVGGSCPVAEEDPARWKAILDVNCFGAFLGCRTFLPAMLEAATPGHILLVASLAGLHPTPTLSAYTASKYGLVGLADTLRGELAGTQVGVSVAYPGGVQTAFTANSAEAFARDGLVQRRTTDTSAILRQGLPAAELAKRLVDAVVAGDYHIFSHGGWGDRLARHFGERLTAYGEEARYSRSDDTAHLDDQVNKGLSQG